jgi:hypothetical protein
LPGPLHLAVQRLVRDAQVDFEFDWLLLAHGGNRWSSEHGARRGSPLNLHPEIQLNFLTSFRWWM